MNDQPIKTAAPDQGIAATKILNPKYSGTSTSVQCERLLSELKKRSVTTYEAMRVLDIYHVPARVLDLRKRGHNIVTVWDTVITESGQRHRVGRYVLESEAING